MFGRPARDTGLESERNNQSSDAQRLHLLNSTHIQLKIERSARLNQLVPAARGNRRQLINTLYATVLSRFPTQVERDAALEYYRTGGLNLRQATHDLVWALINMPGITVAQDFTTAAYNRQVIVHVSLLSAGVLQLAALTFFILARRR